MDWLAWAPFVPDAEDGIVGIEFGQLVGLGSRLCPSASRVVGQLACVPVEASRLNAPSSASRGAWWPRLAGAAKLSNFCDVPALNGWREADSNRRHLDLQA